jgi:hypothetical protein
VVAAAVSLAIEVLPMMTLALAVPRPVAGVAVVAAAATAAAAAAAVPVLVTGREVAPLGRAILGLGAPQGHTHAGDDVHGLLDRLLHALRRRERHEPEALPAAVWGGTEGIEGGMDRTQGEGGNEGEAGRERERSMFKPHEKKLGGNKSNRRRTRQHEPASSTPSVPLAEAGD